MMRYQHFIWDFDGTLFDTYPVMVRALCETLWAAGYPAEEQTVQRDMKISIGETLRAYQQRYGFDKKLVEDYRAHRVALELQEVKPFPGVREVLERITAAGGDHFICTHRGESIHELLRQAGVDDGFREVVTTEYHFKRKPDPESVQYLLDKYDLSPAETLMIGDRPLDIEAGHNAGVAGCFFDPDGATIDGVEYTISDLSELLHILGC